MSQSYECAACGAAGVGATPSELATHATGHATPATMIIPGTTTPFPSSVFMFIMKYSQLKAVTVSAPLNLAVQPTLASKVGLSLRHVREGVSSTMGSGVIMSAPALEFIFGLMDKLAGFKIDRNLFFKDFAKFVANTDASDKTQGTGSFNFRAGPNRNDATKEYSWHMLRGNVASSAKDKSVEFTYRRLAMTFAKELVEIFATDPEFVQERTTGTNISQKHSVPANEFYKAYSFFRGSQSSLSASDKRLVREVLAHHTSVTDHIDGTAVHDFVGLGAHNAFLAENIRTMAINDTINEANNSKGTSMLQQRIDALKSLNSIIAPSHGPRAMSP